MNERTAAVCALTVSAAGAGVVALATSVTPSHPTVNSLSHAILATAAASVICGALAFAKHGRLALFSPLTWFVAAYFVFFTLRPAYDLHSGGSQQRHGLDLGPFYPYALELSIAGLAAFAAGYFAARGTFHIPKRSIVPLSRQATLAAAIVATSVAGTALFLILTGGGNTLRMFFGGRSDATSAVYATTSGYLYTAPLWATSTGLLIYCHGRLERKRIITAVGLAVLTYSQILTIGVGDRVFLLPTLLGVLLVPSAIRGRTPALPNMMIAVLVLFLIAVTLPRIYRDRQATAPSGGSVSQQFTERSALDDFLGGEDTAMAASFALELGIVPRDLGFRYGSTYLGSALAPIPRQLVHKPPVYNRDLDRQLFPGLYDQVGFAYGFWGEPYYNFGIPGLLIFSALVGALSRRGFNWFEARFRWRDPLVVASYLSVLPLVVAYSRDGINLSPKQVFFALVPLALLWSHSRRALKPSADVSAVH